MSAIITEKFRQHNATQFYESFTETSKSSYYLFIGKSTAYTTATTTGVIALLQHRLTQLVKRNITHGTPCWLQKILHRLT
jgi:hypothetical protein